MNLMHAFQKRDKAIVFGTEVVPVGGSVGGRRFSSFSVPAGQSIRVRTALKWYPFCKRPETTGWYLQAPARAPADGGAPSSAELWVAFVGPDATVRGKLGVSAGSEPVPIPLPPLEGAAEKLAELDLVVTNVSASKQAATLLVSEIVPVEPLYGQAVGVGCEIGPGPAPRILPSPERDVYYVERETVEDWQAKYPGSAKQAASRNEGAFGSLWDRYTIGRAHDLPFADGTLDFIFSAHVFEHLVNPLGHLAYWRTKLRDGGRVLAIVPQIHGCLDFRNRPTTMESAIAQFERGGFEETVAHHAPYATVRGIDPQRLFDSGYSSHFSFLEPANLTQMLDFAVGRLGYKRYDIEAGENSKAINFALHA